MRSLNVQLKDETGLVTGMMLLMLAVFTVLGVSATVISMTEMSLASNDQFFKIAFYGAEAARGYVPRTTNLYGAGNITVNQGTADPEYITSPLNSW